MFCCFGRFARNIFLEWFLFFWRRRRRLESGQSKPETPVSSDSDIRENPRWASENPFRPASDLPCFVCFCFFLPSFTGFPFTAIGARSGAGCSDGRDVRESMPGIRASAASIRNWRLFRLYRVFTGLSFSSWLVFIVAMAASTSLVKMPCLASKNPCRMSENPRPAFPSLPSLTDEIIGFCHRFTEFYWVLPSFTGF